MPNRYRVTGARELELWQVLDELAGDRKVAEFSTQEDARRCAGVLEADWRQVLAEQRARRIARAYRAQAAADADPVRRLDRVLAELEVE